MANDLAMHWERDDVGLNESRAALVEALVRACLVIVDQELLDHSLQVAGAENEQVPTNLSQIEFARGDRKGSFTTSTPSEPKT